MNGPVREPPLNAILARPLVEHLPRHPRSPRDPAHAIGEQADIDQLAQAASRGDVEAVGRLYDRLVGPVHRYVGVRVRRREDAEDITQLVFERIVAALPRYRHIGKPFTAWAFRIAHNAIVDHVRRAQPVDPLPDDYEPTNALGLEALTVRGEEIRELRTAIRRLTGDQQEALALRFAAGLSAEEAAQVMGRQAGTVRGLTFRAIAALRRHLAEEPRR